MTDPKPLTDEEIAKLNDPLFLDVHSSLLSFRSRIVATIKADRAASAAWDARVALETCIRECQDSAALLVDRMIRLTEPQEAGVANRVESVSL